MSVFTYSEFLTASKGQALSAAVPFETGDTARLWTDTRTLQSGDFFLPLSGENFDGHTYLDKAFAQGAVGAFVAKDKAAAHPEWQRFPNVIVVKDPLVAYLAMAQYHRRKINPLVIAVTGSSGKTTTKEMLAAAFGGIKKTVKTEKNFNNEVGVCQTLLSIAPDTEILIVEMGMRGPRQICILSEAAAPDASIVVNVGAAHIGFLGSLEAIAAAKLEIVEGMEPVTGVLVVNGDDALLRQTASHRWHGKLVQYYLADARNIKPVQTAEQSGVQFEYAGETVTLSVPGSHMVSNALGVLKLGEALGFPVRDLARGLSAFVSEKGRWERVTLDGFENVSVINDAYNANPDSAKASIQAFLESMPTGAKTIIVLGGMKELGDFSDKYHKELGEWIGHQKGVSALITVGEEAALLALSARQGAPYPVCEAATVQAAAEQLNATALLSDVTLYLKGSRAYALETLATLLVAPPVTANKSARSQASRSVTA